MELHRLQCFQVVVEEGGFKRATTRLHLTQPALSYQIKQLEEELGAQLLYRRPGGIVPTEAGRLLLHYAQLIDAAVLRAERAVRDVAEQAAGEIRIGTVNSIGTHLLPEVLRGVRERCPTARPNVSIRDCAANLEELIADKLDVAVVSNPPADKRLRYQKLLEEQVCLVCGEGHPLFGVESVEPSDVKAMQFVALSTETPTGARTKEHLGRLGLEIEPALTSENVETIRSIVEDGKALAFLPEMVVREACASPARPHGRLWRCRMGPPLMRSIVLVTGREIAESRLVKCFVTQLRRVAHELARAQKA